MHQCPSCGSERIHRSRTRSIWERSRKVLTSKRPYRCRACGWRGWGLDPGPQYGDTELALAGRALAPDPPNLKGTALARGDLRPPDIDPAAFDALDVLDPVDAPRR
jgi:predicted RNA-binding Zn-ribbon protein involved in translation (DUF1610 family)